MLDHPEIASEAVGCRCTIHQNIDAILRQRRNDAGVLVIKQIGKNFTPALGFINRTDIRQYQGTVANLTRYRGKLEFEGSWRHDQYSDVGGTSNPKVAFN